MLNLPRPVRSPPWFWSDQFDVNIQILGRLDGISSRTIGNPVAGNGCWLSFRDDALAGVVAFNRPRDIQVLRRVLQRGIVVTPERLSIAADDLATLLRPAPDQL